MSEARDSELQNMSDRLPGFTDLGTSSVVKDEMETSAFLRISEASSVASGLPIHQMSNAKLSTKNIAKAQADFASSEIGKPSWDVQGFRNGRLPVIGAEAPAGVAGANCSKELA